MQEKSDHIGVNLPYYAQTQPGFLLKGKLEKR